MRISFFRFLTLLHLAERNLLRSLSLAASAIALAFILFGCNSSGGTTGPEQNAEDPYLGRELPLGAYFIQTEYDEDIRYDQFFIVRNGGEWEFAEFGFNSLEKLVELTRVIGIYKMDSASLTLQVTHSANISGSTPISDAQIANMGFSRTRTPSTQMDVSDLDAASFRARDLFAGRENWSTYELSQLPRTVPAYTPVPRVFEAAWITAPDTVMVTVGTTSELDLSGGSPNPNVSMYFLEKRIESTFSFDSSTTGKFKLDIKTPGRHFMYAFARDFRGGIGPVFAVEITVIAADLAPVIQSRDTLVVRINHSRKVEVTVMDAQDDLDVVTWDVGGDGTVDYSAPGSAAPSLTFTKVGSDSVVVTAKDKAGHASRKAIPVLVTNSAPRFMNQFPDSGIYIGDGLPIMASVFDVDSNELDSLHWSFSRTGRQIDTVTPLRGKNVLRFDSMKTYEGMVYVFDSQGLVDSSAWRAYVHGYRRLGFSTLSASHSVLSFKGKLWAIGGADFQGKAQVKSGTDGTEWTQYEVTGTPPTWTNPLLVEFNEKIWLFSNPEGNQPQYAVSSPDGVQWSIETNKAPAGYVALVKDNKLWLMGADSPTSKSKQVWSSVDGKNWNLVGEGLPWANIAFPKVTVFKDQFYALMPYPQPGSTMDVAYTSEDGVTWTATEFKPPWLTQGNKTILKESNGVLWLFGRDNKLWSSIDGLNWTLRSDGNPRNMVPTEKGILFIDEYETNLVPF